MDQRGVYLNLLVASAQHVHAAALKLSTTNQPPAGVPSWVYQRAWTRRFLGRPVTAAADYFLAYVGQTTRTMR